MRKFIRQVVLTVFNLFSPIRYDRKAGKVDRSIVTNNHRKNHRLSLRVLLPVSKCYLCLFYEPLSGIAKTCKNCPAHKSGVNSGMGGKI